MFYQACHECRSLIRTWFDSYLNHATEFITLVCALAFKDIVQNKMQHNHTPCNWHHIQIIYSASYSNMQIKHLHQHKTFILCLISIGMLGQNDFWQIEFPFFWRWERGAGVFWRQNKSVCTKSEFLENEAHGDVEISVGWAWMGHFGLLSMCQ